MPKPDPMPATSGAPRVHLTPRGWTREKERISVISLSRRRLRSLRVAIPLGLIALMTLASAGIASAESNAINFDSDYDAGNINGQHGWSNTGAYDVAVANVSSFVNASAFGFGTKAIRISNAVASRSFGDQAFAPSLGQAAGEAGKNHFEASFDIGSTMPAQQPGLVNSFSPDNGQGGRMSYLRFEDQTDGIHVFFADYSVGSDFSDLDIATLDRTSAHHVRYSMDFVAGPGNDVVQIFVDGNLEHTGTSWEDYYRFDSEASGAVPATTTMLFRAGGDPVSANVGHGYLIDNISIVSSDTVQCTMDCFVNAATGNDAFGGDSAASAKKTIQGAVSQVSAGGTVHVAAGTYNEQVVASHNMIIDGAAEGTTTIKAPISMTPGIAGQRSIVEIGDGAHVTMSDLTVSGPYAGSGCNDGLNNGIFVAESANLEASHVTVADVRTSDAALQGCIYGRGIRVGLQPSQSGTATLDHVTVTGYQKSGLFVDSTASSLTVTNSIITGVGATPHIAPNGITIINGATASVSGSAISGNRYTGPADTYSADILLIQAGNNVTLTENDISDSDVGIDVSGNSTGIVAHKNSIHDNLAGVDNGSANLIDATCNWWGAADGPDGQGTGTGDTVSTQADFEPWLESSDLDGNCSGVSLRGVLTPAAHNFGDQAVNTTSASSTFTFTNEGYETLNVTDVTLAGLNSGHFGFDINSCDGAALGHDQSCTIDLFFKPVSTTGPKTARLEVDSNDPHTPTAVSNLSGNGTMVAPPAEGTITIVLDSRPDDAQSFGFTGGLGLFNLTDPANKTFTISKPAGDYVVQATKVNGWSLKSLTCTTSETVKRAKGKVAIHLSSGENTTCTFTQTKRLPDASIALSSGGSYTGTGVYASTAQANQTLNQAVTGSQAKSFYVHLTNSSADNDSFNVFSTLTGSTKFAVKFFVGATDVTARVNAGTYIVSLNAGQTVTLQVQVKALAGTPAAAMRNIDLTMKSKSSTSKDVVRGHVTRV